MIILLLFLLIGFYSVPTIYSVDHEEKHVLESTSLKPIHEQFTFNQYDFYSFSDLISNDAFTNYVTFFGNAYNYDLFNSTTELFLDYTTSGYCYFINSNNLTTSNIDENTTRYMTIQRIRLNSQGRQAVNGGNAWQQTFVLNFYSTSSQDNYMTIWFRYIENNRLGGSRTWYTSGIYEIDNNDLVDYSSSLLLCAEYQRDPTLRYVLPYNVTGEPGYTAGVNAGRTQGYNSGYNQGYSDAISSGDAYAEGYQDGYADALDTEVVLDPQIYTIFTGILNVALLPVNMFLTILDFEVFGINIAGFVSSLLTIAIVIMIIRFIFGGKNND